MSLPTSTMRSLARLESAVRQSHIERHQWRNYATAVEIKYPSLQTKYPPPSPGFRPSQAIKQNRFEENLKRIPVVPPPRSTAKVCPDPIAVITQQQLQVLDPTGARTRLFSRQNPERVQPGDILLVRLKTGDPVSGVVLNIRQRHQPVDWAVLLRNNLTRVGVEMWFKIYSPNVEGMEIVQRKERRARRAKLYYMRQTRHDLGSVDGIVKNYLRQRAGGLVGGQGKGRDAKSHKKKSKKKAKN